MARHARPTVRLTRWGTRSLVTAVVGLAAARAGGLAELTLLSAGALAVVAGSWARLRLLRPDLAVDRRVAPGRIPFGETCQVDLRLTNRRRGTAPVTVLGDHLDGDPLTELTLAPLVGGGSRVARYRFTARRRGVARLGPVRMVTTDPLGLARIERWDPATTEAIVLPRIHVLANLAPAPGEEPDVSSATRRVLVSAQDEFATLREYVPGDDVRHVHWPSTARSGRPIVRHFEEPWQRRTLVVLDTRRTAHSAESFERAVSAAASVAVAAHRRGEAVRVVRTDGADSGELDDERHLERLLDELAAVQPRSRGDLGGTLRYVGATTTGARLISCLGERADDLAALAAIGNRQGLHVVVSCGADAVGVDGAIEVRFDHDDTLSAAWGRAVGPDVGHATGPRRGGPP